MQLASLLSVFSAASALGINCRGSSECPANQFNGLQSLRDYICDGSHGLLGRWYNAGEHIAYGTKTVNGGFSVAGPGGVGGGASGSGEYAYAVFFQNTNRAYSGQDACNLLYTLVEHGCLGCGSSPVTELNGSNGDVKDGQLTVNYVR